jgi:hypothetical protein
VNLYSIIRFTINQEEIAKTSCVKRSEPKSCCKGKCQLEKELVQNQTQDNNQKPGTQKIEKVELSPFTSVEKFKYMIGVDATKNSYNSLRYFEINGHLTSIFHPPPILFI